MKRRVVIAVLVGLATPACDSGGKMTCELLADPDNCWAQTVAATAACLPSPATATLATDRRSCSFADGTRIVFDEALPYDYMDVERFAFTIEVDGATCARFEIGNEPTMELEAGPHSVHVEAEREGDYYLQCADGSSYSAPFAKAIDCPAGGVPSVGFDVSIGLVTFAVSSATVQGELFRCEA
jgi:hypothetical protein